MELRGWGVREKDSAVLQSRGVGVACTRGAGVARGTSQLENHQLPPHQASPQGHRAARGWLHDTCSEQVNLE